MEKQVSVSIFFYYYASADFILDQLWQPKKQDEMQRLGHTHTQLSGGKGRETWVELRVGWQESRNSGNQWMERWMDRGRKRRWGEVGELKGEMSGLLGGVVIVLLCVCETKSFPNWRENNRRRKPTGRGTKGEDTRAEESAYWYMYLYSKHYENHLEATIFLYW